MARPSLQGRRVLELGVYIAGPFAGRILAQLGAEVIKVESARGDAARTEPSHANFVANNLGTRSIVVDLRHPEGYMVFERLVRASDVVLNNLSPDATLHLRVMAEDIHRIDPSVIYCHVKGYGRGPRQDEVSTNPLVEASTGVMYRNRPNGRPSRQGLSYYDMSASAFAVIGILAALGADASDPATRTVEVGLYETGLYLAGGLLLGEQYREHGVSKMEDPASFARPGYGAYQTADERWIYLLMLTDDQWRQFCEIMQLPEGQDPSLARVAQRSARAADVEDVVRTAVAAYPFDELAARLRAGNFGYTEVRPPATVLDDEQARQLGKVVNVTFDGIGLRVPSFPVINGAVRHDLAKDPPALGADTVDVLQSIGYETAELAVLLERGVIRAAGKTPLEEPADTAPQRAL